MENIEMNDKKSNAKGVSPHLIRRSNSKGDALSSKSVQKRAGLRDASPAKKKLGNLQHNGDL